MGPYSTEKFQSFLDSHQYNNNGIGLYEQIFGRTFVSTGGVKTTKRFCEEYLHLQPGEKVLDIGCGVGGSAFFMIKNYGVEVHGVDLSSNMINRANEYKQMLEPSERDMVQFSVADAITMDYPDNFYDVVYSRDTILHIEDKETLFRNFRRCLKPGGTLFISDYCRGDKDNSQDFKDYIAQFRYTLLTVKEYGSLLEKVGFRKVKARDVTDYFTETLNWELKHFEPRKQELIEKYSHESVENLVSGWKNKLVRCSQGDQVWGIFHGKKALN